MKREGEIRTGECKVVRKWLISGRRYISGWSCGFKNEKKDDYNVANVNFGVDSFSSWSKYAIVYWIYRGWVIFKGVFDVSLHLEEEFCGEIRYVCVLGGRGAMMVVGV